MCMFCLLTQCFIYTIWEELHLPFFFSKVNFQLKCQSWIRFTILKNALPSHDQIRTHHFWTNFGGKKKLGSRVFLIQYFYIETNRSERGEKISSLCSVMKGVQGRVSSKVGSAPLFVGTWLQLGMAPRSPPHVREWWKTFL
jgi:hypothetical protein